ncbi:MAG: hypothetical protein FK732_12810 [Asgard group archaeon]|nr:hypothetical protein [Asgard group archaeon]
MAKSKMLKKMLMSMGVTFFLIYLVSFSLTSVANDDNGDENGDDDDDRGKNIAYVSIGFFVATAVTNSIYMTNKYARRFLGDEGKSKETKDKISQIYRKIRKPLNYIHYVVGFAALTTLLIHGIKFSNKDEKLVAIGWVTTVVYIFYVLSGLVIWLRIKPIWNSKKTIRVLNKIHKSLILFIGIIVLHIIHVIMAD